MGSFWPEVLEWFTSDVFGKPGQGQILKLYGVIRAGDRGEYNKSPSMQRVIVNAGHPLLIGPKAGVAHVTAVRRALPGYRLYRRKDRCAGRPLGWYDR